MAFGTESLKAAIAALFAKDASRAEVDAAAHAIHHRFSDFARLDANGARTMLPDGSALSPADAGRCLLDGRRTAVFLQGLERAIAAVSASFPGESPNILYAGCGPFAPFCLLFLIHHPSAESRFTLLDIHAESLDAARRIAEVVGVADRIRGYICADAARYESGSRFHIIITEALQAGLAREPQLAITAHLAPQLRPGGIFLPERITVGACLLDGDSNEAIRLGDIFDLNSSAAASLRERLRASVEIPKLPQSLMLALVTRIQVFGPHRLEPMESGLTCPLFLREFGDSDTPARVDFEYRMGNSPGFEWRLLSQIQPHCAKIERHLAGSRECVHREQTVMKIAGGNRRS